MTMTTASTDEIVQNRLQAATALTNIARKQLDGTGYPSPKLFLGGSTARRARLMLEAFLVVYADEKKALAPAQIEEVDRAIAAAKLLEAEAEERARANAGR